MIAEKRNFSFLFLVAADQRHERTPRGRAKVSVNAVAVDPMRPYLFVTGSSDPLGEPRIHPPSKHAVRCMQAPVDPIHQHPVSGLEACLSVPLGRCCIQLACKCTKVMYRSFTQRLAACRFLTGQSQCIAHLKAMHVTLKCSVCQHTQMHSGHIQCHAHGHASAASVAVWSQCGCMTGV